MARKKLIVESSVACKVGTRSLPLARWTAVVQYLSPQFDFVVSPLSFVEIVRSMALGDELSIVEKLKRVEALSPVHPLDPVCLEMPAQFALREVLGKKSYIADAYQGTQMCGDMVTLLRAQGMTNGLRTWLDEVTSKHGSGTNNFVSTHDSMRKVAQPVPTPENWVAEALACLFHVLLFHKIGMPRDVLCKLMTKSIIAERLIKPALGEVGLEIASDET